MSILEWMDTLKSYMKIENIFKSFFFFSLYSFNDSFIRLETSSGSAVSIPHSSFSILESHTQKPHLIYSLAQKKQNTF